MITTFLGLLLGIAAILAGQALEGGHISSLVQPTALLIVLGGTAGAVILQSSPSVLLLGLQMTRWLFIAPETNFERRMESLTKLLTIARKKGLLALEAEVANEKDPFLRRGLRMVTDGSSEDDVYNMLMMELTQWEARLKQASKIWDAAGGYSPTIGILGAVLGLIHVMENLSDPAKLGGGIAVAFVATVYGVASANLIYLPIAKRLQGTIHTIRVFREMTIEGVCCIVRGDNVMQLEERLASFGEH